MKWHISLSILCAFLAGATLTWLLLGKESTPFGVERPADPPAAFDDRFMDDFFDERFFDRSLDPFQEMERMRERIERELNARPGGSPFGSRFKDWYLDRFGASPPTDIHVDEDDEYIYYRIRIGAGDESNVDVRIENGQVILSARVSSEETQTSSGSHTRSSRLTDYRQTFPLPPRADPNGVKVGYDEGEIRLRFRKLTG